jgi:chromate reductase
MVKNKKKILAISGSTRQNSTNYNLIKAIAELSANNFDIEFFEGLTELPHFNPDNDSETVVKQVQDFRKQIREAEGVIICTPEYAMGLPGTLKNALDWTVSSCEFSKKPVMAITASSMGEKAHNSLVGTLEIIEAKTSPGLQLLISFAKTKISNDKKITDKKTLHDVQFLIDNFVRIIEGKE